MSGSGAPDLQAAGTSATAGLRVAVVAASWHTQVMDGLTAGAARAAQQAGVHTSEITVPGSFELAVVAAECAASKRFDAIVALGVVIRGGTPHFEYVCQAATDGLTRVALDHRIPVGFGLLTCDDLDQALDRAGLEGSKEDKGAEAMVSAINAAAVLAQIRAESQD